MSARSSIPRLYVEQELGPRQPVTLSAFSMHYVQRVMRMRNRDHIMVFNGLDGEWQAELRQREQKLELICQSQSRRAIENARYLVADDTAAEGKS